MVNSKHKKTLLLIYKDPLQGSIPWDQIESFLIAIGCTVVSSGGSAITIEMNSIRLNVHRPHPNRDSLRYRVKSLRDFLDKLEIKP